MSRLTLLRAMKHYVGKIGTIRNEIRTERFLNSLPRNVRADIGWPDMHSHFRDRRR